METLAFITFARPKARETGKGGLPESDSPLDTITFITFAVPQPKEKLRRQPSLSRPLPAEAGEAGEGEYVAAATCPLPEGGTNASNVSISSNLHVPPEAMDCTPGMKVLGYQLFRRYNVDMRVPHR